MANRHNVHIIIFKYDAKTRVVKKKYVDVSTSFVSIFSKDTP